MRWFSSDQHFFHKNVIELCSRPFSSLEQMHLTMVQNWTERVQPDDLVYILGDFCFGGTEKWKWAMSHLPGKKHLIMGNHDWGKFKPHRTAEFGLESCQHGLTIEIEPLGSVVLSHFPYSGDHTELDRFQERRPVDTGGFLLHGHVHCLWKKNGKQINVGVDQWGFAPVSELEIIHEALR